MTYIRTLFFPWLTVGLFIGGNMWFLSSLLMLYIAMAHKLEWSVLKSGAIITAVFYVTPFIILFVKG